jgi:hypothetical protein
MKYKEFLFLPNKNNTIDIIIFITNKLIDQKRRIIPLG